MSNKKFRNNEIIIARLKEELKVGTDSELAKVLDYSAGSAISNWKTGNIEWGRILRKFPSINVNYIITGEDKPEKTGRSRQPIDDSWDQLARHVSVHGIGKKERVQLIAVLRDRARMLSDDLRYFSDLIDELEEIDRDDETS